MEQHFKLTDDELESQILNCSLDPTVFTHEAHIRLSWVHITKYGVVKAEENIKRQFKELVTALGATDKYNETLTVAAIKIVNCFIEKSNPGSFEQLIKFHPRLIKNFKGLIASHYGFDIYNNERAKKEYLQPDLIPFN